MASNTVLYKLQTYYSQDNFVFDSIYSHFFNPIYAGDLYSSSSQVTVTKKFRADLAISDITVDFSFLKIISILNEKPTGLFSYNENDIIYVPLINTVTFINTDYYQLVEPNITLDNNINDVLKNAYSALQDNMSKLDITQIFKYINQTTVVYLFLENQEYLVNQKYKGLV